MTSLRWLVVIACIAVILSFQYRPSILKSSLLSFAAKARRTTGSTSLFDTAVDTPAPEKFAFESNVARVMDIIINSLYSNKDVFIRELISNAADACDKKRFNALTDGLTAENTFIRVYPNREKNTLTIEDKGIGMNKEDLIQNLGKIAESGTKKFMEANKNRKDDVNLIGQFGVGFYSGFLVANKVEVITKGSKGEQLRWTAVAESLGEYTIGPDEDDSEPIETTGTRIVLHLKDESDQYLDDVALKTLIEKYSEFVSFPIELVQYTCLLACIR